MLLGISVLRVSAQPLSRIDQAFSLIYHPARRIGNAMLPLSLYLWILVARMFRFALHARNNSVLNGRCM